MKLIKAIALTLAVASSSTALATESTVADVVCGPVMEFARQAQIARQSGTTIDDLRSFLEDENVLTPSVDTMVHAAYILPIEEQAEMKRHAVDFFANEIDRQCRVAVIKAITGASI
jgi:hypothetical protein